MIATLSLSLQYFFLGHCYSFLFFFHSLLFLLARMHISPGKARWAALVGRPTTSKKRRRGVGSDCRFWKLRMGLGMLHTWLKQGGGGGKWWRKSRGVECMHLLYFRLLHNTLFVHVPRIDVVKICIHTSRHSQKYV